MKIETLLPTLALIATTRAAPPSPPEHPTISVTTRYILFGKILTTDTCVGLTPPGVQAYCGYLRAIHNCPCSDPNPEGNIVVDCSMTLNVLGACKGIFVSDQDACSNDGGVFRSTL
ncbi:hypothetical protein BP00DRAFT_428955 [Aspergillus indologenus CBS 114.80]|uniref:Extracellular membrane protein CFEM domain-containing protein n=1 Tax=Aspergillus indologenus CBS 114.80 TaxID=1450541 RepID=A0A2V5HTK0_9EURO|nr:hypothetical protein BP00DRAFT_428955 [Aspergillus indologenus CBS 114.80]